MVYFLETTYDEYANQVKTYNLHPELQCIYDQFPENLSLLPNLLFYGGSGTGKYSQVLYAIQQYSASKLKYRKNIEIQFNKQQYLYAVSDIHFEVDMSFLGCQAKLLWHEIYSQIVEIVSARKQKIGIILCKNFHMIHRELLDVFYSYMQQHNQMFHEVSYTGIRIKFVFISENISFLPSNILDSCATIRCMRPSMHRYIEMKCHHDVLQQSIAGCTKDSSEPSENLIRNIKQFLMGHDSHYTTRPFRVTVANLVRQICDEPLSVLMLVLLRDYIYDMLTFNLDVRDSIWEVISEIVQREFSCQEQEQLGKALLKLFPFFQYFNNNYRPIYHMEHFFIQLICAIRKPHREEEQGSPLGGV